MGETKAKEATVSESTDNIDAKKDGKRIRKCMKKEPLQPLNTGSLKKATNCKKSVMKPRISKRKLKSKTSKSTKHKTLTSKKSATSIKSRKKCQTNTKTVKQVAFSAPAEAAEPEAGPGPGLGCVACAEGRKGEGDLGCWVCRLARLAVVRRLTQDIADIDIASS